MLTKKTARELIVQARTRLLFTHPFIGALSLRLTPIEDPTCDTLWTNGTTLGYNPKYIESHSIDYIKSMMAHEVFHIVFKHHLRRDDRNFELWNNAGDYVINAVLEREGFAIHKNWYYDSAYADKSTEYVYDRLFKETSSNQSSQSSKPQPQPQQSQSKQQQSQSQQSQPQQQQQQSQPQQQQQTQGQSQSQQQTQTGGQSQSQQQTQTQGQPQSHQPSQQQTQQQCAGQVRDAPVITPEDKKAAEKEWEIWMRQAVNYTKSAGTLSGDLAEIIEAMLDPKPHWRERLSEFINEIARDDYSWSKPNRRYLPQGVYLPDLYSRKLGKIIIAVDTSGSMGRDELEAIATEITGILEEFQDFEVTVIYCDTKVYEDAIEKFTSDTLPVKLHAKGGGGTKFLPLFKFIESQTEQDEEEPQALLFFTDMMTFDSSKIYSMQPPDYAVLWCSTNKNNPTGNFKDKLPFGELIHIDYAQ